MMDIYRCLSLVTLDKWVNYRSGRIKIKDLLKELISRSLLRLVKARPINISNRVKTLAYIHWHQIKIIVLLFKLDQWVYPQLLMLFRRWGITENSDLSR